MCVSIPPKYSVSSAVGYLKGKSAIEIFEKFSKFRRNFRGHHFWARGYYVSTVGLDEAKVRNYIKNQEESDRLSDQGEAPHIDPFE
jgi:putative transposase